MSAESVIVFDTDGTGHCLYTEAIPLAEIGELELCRASNVDFNRTHQEWEVITDIMQPAVFSHPSREACIRWEREHFNAQLLAT